MFYYAELKNGKMINKGECTDRVPLIKNQIELTKEQYESAQILPAAVLKDGKGKITSIVNGAKKPPTAEKINKQVVRKIRERYSIDDEFQMQRVGTLNAYDVDFREYLKYVDECRDWGKSEKDKILSQQEENL